MGAPVGLGPVQVRTLPEATWRGWGPAAGAPGAAHPTLFWPWGPSVDNRWPAAGVTVRSKSLSSLGVLVPPGIPEGASSSQGR